MDASMGEKAFLLWGVALYGNPKFRTLFIIIPRIRGDDYASRASKSGSELAPQLESCVDPPSPFFN